MLPAKLDQLSVARPRSRVDIITKSYFVQLVSRVQEIFTLSIKNFNRQANSGFVKSVVRGQSAVREGMG